VWENPPSIHRQSGGKMSPTTRAPLDTKLDAYSDTVESVANSEGWRGRLGRWPVYAAATGSALAMATSADASIIHGFANVSVSVPRGNPISTSDHQFFNIAGLGSLSIGIQYKHQPGVLYGTAYLTGSAFGQSVFITSGPQSLLRRVPPNAPIYPGSLFNFVNSRGNLQMNRVLPIANVGGNFPSGVTGTAAFILDPSSASGGPYFGWIHLKWTSSLADGFPDTLYAYDWGVNNVAWGPINAGELAAVPEPGTFGLALLASGAAGILAWRKRAKPPAE
jgi:hypothetical protein